MRGATTPHLELDGFSGPLAALLMLARAQRIDLRHLSLPALVEQPRQGEVTLAQEGEGFAPPILVSGA